jgi:CCR4-NOT transcriptional regulation complex NOT5 subunit
LFFINAYVHLLPLKGIFAWEVLTVISPNAPPVQPSVPYQNPIAPLDAASSAAFIAAATSSSSSSSSAAPAVAAPASVSASTDDQGLIAANSASVSVNTNANANASSVVASPSATPSGSVSAAAVATTPASTYTGRLIVLHDPELARGDNPIEHMRMRLERSLDGEDARKRKPNVLEKRQLQVRVHNAVTSPLLQDWQVWLVVIFK